VIISLKTASIHSLKDLNGKRFAFVDYQSASGYLYPMALLEKNGLNPEKNFSRIFMLKKR